MTQRDAKTFLPAIGFVGGGGMPVRKPLPPSLYAETAVSAPATPPLEGDRRVAVAVIGGGFTGLSTALHLAEGGADVAVLEANEPGWGASGRNGGQVNPGLKHDPDRIEADFGPDLGPRMIALSGNAPNVVFDLIRRHQITCEALQSGTLRAAVHERSAAAVRASADQCARRGMPVALLDRDAVAAATGTQRYVVAMLDRRGGQVNPLSYARGLARAALQAGVAVYGATPVLRMARNGRSWQIVTPTGTVHAEQVVLATNGYTDDVWPGLRRSIVPVFSAIVASEPLPADVAATIMPAQSVLYEAETVTVYYRLDRSGRLLMGGRSPSRDITKPDELSYLIRYVRRLWPHLGMLRWTHAWSGQLAITPDHYPHVHEPAPGVIACLGYNGRGVAMATVMGQQLAHRILRGGDAVLDMPVTTMRRIPFHGLWRSAVAARIAYARIHALLGL
jgi:glycine/D-amino acid oxidase-like deaminating enzyme